MEAPHLEDMVQCVLYVHLGLLLTISCPRSMTSAKNVILAMSHLYPVAFSAIPVRRATLPPMASTAIASPLRLLTVNRDMRSGPVCPMNAKRAPQDPTLLEDTVRHARNVHLELQVTLKDQKFATAA